MNLRFYLFVSGLNQGNEKGRNLRFYLFVSGLNQGNEEGR